MKLSSAAMRRLPRQVLGHQRSAAVMAQCRGFADEAKAPAKNAEVHAFMQKVIEKNPAEEEFHQAVEEVVEAVLPFVNANPKYKQSRVLERMIEPERVMMFRVPWTNDAGEVQVNRGFRVNMNSAIGPYKGGLRFHPSVKLGTLKFLAFEQVFKNSLTTLAMGGGKGGSDFDPKGKSDLEVMRFCQSFMTELQRHIGANTDVPAGDIGVGGREIGFMYGQYKRLRNEFTGVLTGKPMEMGGSLIRPEATGYGCVYFVDRMLHRRGQSLKGMTVAVSGSGNVAQYATEKVNHLGGKVVTLSDSSGFIHDPEGICNEKLEFVMELKNVKRGRIEEYCAKFPGSTFTGNGARPWAGNFKVDVALPCATQNELELADAQNLVDNGCFVVAEGANMPTAPDAVNFFIEKHILFAPGKAANAGGVAVSGLEMSQNSLRLNWTRAEVDDRLQQIMTAIHEQCVEYGASRDSDYVNYVQGANVGGFVKVADAMLAQGIV